MTVTLNTPISDFNPEQLLTRSSAFKIRLYVNITLNTARVTNKRQQNKYLQKMWKVRSGKFCH